MSDADPPAPLTIAVPMHGDVGLLLPLLDAMDAQARDIGATPRVLVSDDASSPPVADVLDVAAFPSLDLVVVRSDRNRGPGGARNVALASIDSSWVAFLDADVVPVAGWLARAIELAATTEDVDVIEGRVIVPGGDDLTPFSHATEIEPPAQRGGGNLLIRADVLRTVGGFDERYYDVQKRLHFREDADLAFRLEGVQARFRYDPALVVAHPPLPPSFWVPVRLARRYHFDPLLARTHPTAFKAMNDTRRIGPLSLRAARHWAAMLFALGVVALAAGVVLGAAALWFAGAVLAVIGWAAGCVALVMGRKVTLVHAVLVAVVALLVPWVYLQGYWSGVLRFRHRPRL